MIWYSNRSRSLAALDAVGGDFDFANATEGEQKFYEVFRRLFRGLFDDVANGVGDRSLKHHALSLEAREVDAHELARLEHPQNHPTPSEIERKRGADRAEVGLMQLGAILAGCLFGQTDQIAEPHLESPR